MRSGDGVYPLAGDSKELGDLGDADQVMHTPTLVLTCDNIRVILSTDNRTAPAVR